MQPQAVSPRAYLSAQFLTEDTSLILAFSYQMYSMLSSYYSSIWQISHQHQVHVRPTSLSWLNFRLYKHRNFSLIHLTSIRYGLVARTIRFQFSRNEIMNRVSRGSIPRIGDIEQDLHFLRSCAQIEFLTSSYSRSDARL